MAYSPLSCKSPRMACCAALAGALGTFASPAVLALNAQGPLIDILVDGASGEISSAEAQSILDRFNQYDLSAYSLQFNDGSTISLNQSPEALDQALLAMEKTGVDLSAIAGPDGTVVFGEEEITCSNVTPNFASDPTLALESCIGVQLYQQSADASAAAALSQINALDLFINRPTTQLMMDIRRFVSGRPGGLSSSGQSGGGSGDESLLAGPWGFYFQGGGSFANVNGKAGSMGFRADNQFATSGVDYRFSDNVVAGFLFNYMGSDSRIDKGMGRLGADIYRFMPFVSITPFANAYIDILTGYSYHDYSSSRSSASVKANADHSADQALASITLGYTYPIGALEISPFAGGSYISTDIGGYTEKGRGSLLKVGGYQVSSWTSNLGLQMAYSYSAPFGVLQPTLRLEWVHEFDNERSGVNVFLPTQGLSVNLPTAKPIRDWGNISAGMQTIFANGFMGFVNYQAQVMSAGENHTVEGGVRIEF